MFVTKYKLKPLIENPSKSCLLLPVNVYSGRNEALDKYIPLDPKTNVFKSEDKDISVESVYGSYMGMTIDNPHEKYIKYELYNNLLIVYFYLPIEHNNYSSSYFRKVLDGESFDPEKFLCRVLTNTLVFILGFLRSQGIENVYIVDKYGVKFEKIRKDIYLSILKNYNVFFIDYAS